MDAPAALQLIPQRSSWDSLKIYGKPRKTVASEGSQFVSTPFRLQVPRAIFEAMLAQAAAEAPNECCGWLLGNVNAAAGVALVTERHPLTNTLASPTRYLADPKQLLMIERRVREQKLSHLSIYHSHPTSEPVPSRTDMEWAYYPGIVSLIISLVHTPPLVRGWWVSETDYREAEWEIVD
jgi:proteasome lid subunit RPN8/RPN11